MDWGLTKVLDDGVPTSRWDQSPRGDPSRTAHRVDQGNPSVHAAGAGRGARLGIGRRSDVFGLGAILCTILDRGTALRRFVPPGRPRPGGPRRAGRSWRDWRRAALTPSWPRRAALSDAAPRGPARRRRGGGGRSRRLSRQRRSAACARRRWNATPRPCGKPVETSRRRRLRRALFAVGPGRRPARRPRLAALEQVRAAARLQTEAQLNQEFARADSLREQGAAAADRRATPCDRGPALGGGGRASAGRAEAVLAVGPATAELAEATRGWINALRTEAGEDAADRALLRELDAAREKRGDLTDDDYGRPNPKGVLIIGCVLELMPTPGRFAAMTSTCWAPRRSRLLGSGKPAGVGRDGGGVDDWLALEAGRPAARRSWPWPGWRTPTRSATGCARRWRRATAPPSSASAGEAGDVPASLGRAPLADGLHLAGRAEAVRCTSGRRRSHPTDFWINNTLAVYLASHDPARTEEAIRYFTAALAAGRPCLRPRRSGQGPEQRVPRWPEAVASFKTALECKPDFAEARLGLAEVLHLQNRTDEAIAMCRAAYARPDVAMVHFKLILYEVARGRLDRAGELRAIAAVCAGVVLHSRGRRPPRPRREPGGRGDAGVTSCSGVVPRQPRRPPLPGQGPHQEKGIRPGLGTASNGPALLAKLHARPRRIRRTSTPRGSTGRAASTRTGGPSPCGRGLRQPALPGRPRRDAGGAWRCVRRSL